MKKFGLGKQVSATVSGQQLVADFQSALLNLLTMDAAQAEARRSEANVTAALRHAAPAANGVFITAGDVAPLAQDSLVKDSVDAHLKKVQAAQISTFTTEQVAQMELQDLKSYKNRKVRVTRLGSKDSGAITPLWLDQRTGQLKESKFTGQSVTGIIDDLSFERNILLLRPTLLGRTLTPGRKYFGIAVVDIKSLEPAVKIDLA